MEWEIKVTDLYRDGQKFMELTRTEANILQLFLSNPDQVFSVKELAEKVGAKEDYVRQVLAKFAKISELPVVLVKGWKFGKN